MRSPGSINSRDTIFLSQVQGYFFLPSGPFWTQRLLLPWQNKTLAVLQSVFLLMEPSPAYLPRKVLSPEKSASAVSPQTSGRCNLLKEFKEITLPRAEPSVPKAGKNPPAERPCLSQVAASGAETGKSQQ